MRDRIAEALYTLAYWAERLADRIYYGKCEPITMAEAIELQRKANAIRSELMREGWTQR